MAKKQVEETKNACLEFYNKSSKKAIQHIFDADEIRVDKINVWDKAQRGVLEKAFLKITVVKGEKETELIIGAKNNNPWMLPSSELGNNEPEIKRY